MKKPNYKKSQSSSRILLIMFSYSIIQLFCYCSCSKIYDNVEKYVSKETIYADRFDGIIRVQIGYERVEVDLMNAGRIPSSMIKTGKAIKTVIECEDFTEPGHRRVIDSICSWVNIKGLTKLKNYRFSIYTEDEFENRSIPLTLEAKPFTAENLDALELTTPTLLESTTAALVEWKEPISAVTHKVYRYSYRYTDKDNVLRTGKEKGDLPSFFIENVTKGVDVPVTFDCRIIPTLSNANGTYTPILDSIDWQATINLLISENAEPAIFLKTPAPAFEIDLDANDDTPLTFSWIKVAETNGYTLKISNSPGFTEGQTYSINAGDAGEYTLAGDIGSLLNLNQYRSPVSLHWTVTPTVQNTAIKTQTRGFTAIPLSLTKRIAAIGGCTGFWEFSDASNLEKATIGNDLVGYYRNVTGTIGIPSKAGYFQIAGITSDDYAIEMTVGTNLFFCNHGINSYGLIGEWTIMMDVKRVVAAWVGLIQPNVLNDGDCKLTLNSTGTVGPGTYSTKAMVLNKWYNVVCTLKAPEYYHAYVNGELSNTFTKANAESDLYKLSPNGVLFFTNNTLAAQRFHISSIAVFNKALTEEEIKSLGEI